MDRYGKVKQFCAWTLGFSLILVAVLLGIDHFRSARYGGPLSSNENSLLKIGGITAIASWLVPMVLSNLGTIGKFIPWPGGGGSSASPLGGVVSVIETLMSFFNIDPKAVIESLVNRFRLRGLPTWFYFGIGWANSPSWVLNAGPVPNTLPAPAVPAKESTNISMKTDADPSNQVNQQQQTTQNGGINLANLGQK